MDSILSTDVVLCCVVLCYVVLCCVVLCCVVLCCVVLCCVVLCCVVLCCVVLCCVVLCCVVLYCIVLYCIVLCCALTYLLFFTPIFSTSYIKIFFTPTIPHCSMAQLIGLCIRVKLLRSLPRRFKVDIYVTPGTHNSEEAVNRQLNDKERVAAALENAQLLKVINGCIAPKNNLVVGG